MAESEKMRLCEILFNAGVRLKPCPFCGAPLDDFPLWETVKTSHSEEYLIARLNKGHIISSDNGYEVTCMICGAHGGSSTSILDAVNKWNTRRHKRKTDSYGSDEFYGYSFQFDLFANGTPHCCGKCGLKTADRKDGEDNNG